MIRLYIYIDYSSEGPKYRSGLLHTLCMFAMYIERKSNP